MHHLRGVRLLLVTDNVVPSSPILVTLMMQAIRSSETSVLTRVTKLTSQKTAFLIVTAVKTSNLTRKTCRDSRYPVEIRTKHLVFKYGM
jgi:hypothetical protein